MELLIGPPERLQNSKKSGWNKSPTKALYHDYADMINSARNSHDDGQNDSFVDLRMLHCAIILALQEKKRSDSDTAIIWHSQIGRMTRDMGKAKLFDIIDLGPSRLAEDVVVARPRNLYSGFHYSKEQLVKLQNCNKGYRDQFGSQILVNSANNGTKLDGNGLGIFFMRLTMKAMETHLLEGNPVETFKHSMALKIQCFDGGRNFTVFFDEGTDRPTTYIKNFWTAKKHGSRRTMDTWFSKNWTKLPYYREGSFDHIDADKWDKLVGGEVVVGQEEDPLVCLYDTCEDAELQDFYIQECRWMQAKKLYLADGIVSNKFMTFVVEIRKLWQKTRIDYVLDVGTTYWESHAEKLDQYVEMKGRRAGINRDSTYVEKMAMMRGLFGNQVA
jgi:hypothetical protein